MLLSHAFPIWSCSRQVLASGGGGSNHHLHDQFAIRDGSMDQQRPLIRGRVGTCKTQIDIKESLHCSTWVFISVCKKRTVYKKCKKYTGSCLRHQVRYSTEEGVKYNFWHSKIHNQFCGPVENIQSKVSSKPFSIYQNVQRKKNHLLKKISSLLARKVTSTYYV